MKAFFWKVDRVVHRETDGVDLVSKKYVIRIRISGITIFRKREGRLKKVYDEHFDFTGEPT